LAGNNLQSPYSWQFTTYALDVLAAPVLLSPADGASDVSLTPTLMWSAVSGADSYQVGIHDGGRWILIEHTTATSYTVQGGVLANGHGYRWYVWPHNVDGFGITSGRSFTTQ
jgi:hypothetical protein